MADPAQSTVDATVIAQTISQLYTIDLRAVQPEPVNMVWLVEHILHEADSQCVATSELADAQKALERFGRHLEDCALVSAVRCDNTPRPPCNCGWAKFEEKA
jgi:hypothetical protein